MTYKTLFPYAITLGLLGCGGDSTGPQLNPILAGGDTTVFQENANAFSLPAANLTLNQRADFQAGNSLFRQPWVIAPASADSRDGLGPLFNVSACQSCHIRDGRGHAPVDANDDADSMIVRASIPAQTTSQQALLDSGNAGLIPEPNYGNQIHDRAIPGVDAEAKVVINYQTEIRQYADNSSVTLRRPTLSLSNLAYGDLHSQAQLSARIAPSMVGMGLLEAIDADQIIAAADPNDSDGDGISGRPNLVFNLQTQTAQQLGRFGWKAAQPTVLQQSAAAFAGDIGITSQLFDQQPCTSGQSDCLAQPTGGSPEVEDVFMGLVHFYSQHLAVPARRDVGAENTERGEALFYQVGCDACHTPHWKTGNHPEHSHLSQQDIFPYTDLLLHDMGPDLADDVSEFAATGSEWRTAPLWGIGLSQVVAGDQPVGYLHDGRAETLEQAIIWHGGEAQQSQTLFMNLSATDRQALIEFLESL